MQKVRSLEMRWKVICGVFDRRIAQIAFCVVERNPPFLIPSFGRADADKGGDRSTLNISSPLKR